ncbi:MAG: amino acid racemase [Bacteroidetes bacterium]|nr:amino acid racemase [Bacteroidota bacterium]
MKKIGILGGIGHYTTIEYYARLMDLYKKQYNNLDYPEIVIYSLSHGKFKQYEDHQEIDKYLNYLSEGIDGLINSGAEIIALAANSPHRVINELRDRFNLPIISAIDSAFNEAKRLNIKKGLLLGIKFTMQSSFYQEQFSKGSIELIIPSTEDQEIVNDIIFNRLINGQEIDQVSKDSILNMISRYPVDGVILGCMRLPVFFNAETIVGTTLVNTLDKHIEDILESAK